MIHRVAALPQMPDLEDPTNYPARLRRLEEILHRKLVYINSLEEENKTYREQLGLEGPLADHPGARRHRLAVRVNKPWVLSHELPATSQI
jgi:hypothetical protein